jgi:hypothetical protein
MQEELENLAKKYHVKTHKVCYKYLDYKAEGLDSMDAFKGAEVYAKKVSKIRKWCYVVGIGLALKLSGAYLVTSCEPVKNQYHKIKEGIEYSIDKYKMDNQIERIYKQNNWKKYR